MPYLDSSKKTALYTVILHLIHSSSVNIFSLYGLFEVIWGQNNVEHIHMESVLFQGQFHHENRDCFMFPRRRTRTGYWSNQQTKVQHVYNSILPPVYTALFCFPRRCSQDKQNINFRQSQWPATLPYKLKISYDRPHDSLLSGRQLKGLWK